ncbi:zinc dependent phospholipase C family protein [Chitinophaga lutea]
MKNPLFTHAAMLLLLIFTSNEVFAWGFFAHERINRLAVFALPPEMMVFFKPNIGYLVQRSTAPDKRRYMVPDEGARHYIDLDHYGKAPFDGLPRVWAEAEKRLTADTLQRYGILPWHLERMMHRLTRAFEDSDKAGVLRLAAELGHYIGDAHVPLHACSNHNSQLTGQEGIHGLWESRIPELLADTRFDYWTGPAGYIADFRAFAWKTVLESAAAADTVLKLEKTLTGQFAGDRKYAWELRKGQLVRQYATPYVLAYQQLLGDMVERRMKASVAAVASAWYTAWIEAGQPKLQNWGAAPPTSEETTQLGRLDSLWKRGRIFGRDH